MAMSATTTAKPTSAKRDDSDKPTTHERVVGVIEAAAYGDKALAGHNLNALVNRERIGWSDGRHIRIKPQALTFRAVNAF